MQVVLLAGGLGTRLAEETSIKPKPMVEIGGMPIIWHIMKTYEHYGFNDFIICCGYKGYVIKEFFANYFLHANDITVDLRENSVVQLSRRSEQWRITLIDTGANTMTGGRVLRCKPHILGETFLMTYGDGVADINLGALIEKHKRSGKLATLTAVKPPGRFGALHLGEEGSTVDSFLEKPEGDNSYINGGFFVLDRRVFEYIKEGDSTVWEQKPLQTLAAEGKLGAFIHNGFWQPMDTLRDKMSLDSMIAAEAAPWIVW